MSYKVVNTHVVPGMDYGEKLLEPLDITLVNGSWHTEDDLISNIAGADAIICSGPVQPWTSRVVQTLSNCRILATNSIGYDRIDVEAATKLGIAVTNNPDFCIDEVSSQAVALIMALSRRLLQIDRIVKEQRRHLPPGNREAVKNILYPIFRMSEQTLGIIGFGKIGTAVALNTRGLGMKIIAYDPYVLGAVMSSHGVVPVDLDTLLRESDFISINAALTDETRGMIGDEEFKKMKPNCYLVNTARGKIVKQSALINALREGLIAGAGLDVTENEPIPEGDPILQMPNVILTGHSAWYSTTSDSPSEHWHKSTQQILMALNGEWPTYAVNPEIKRTWLEKWGKKA